MDSIKEALRNGATGEELIDSLTRQIADAEAEIAKEKKTEKTNADAREMARQDAVDALYDYAVMMGALSGDEDDEKELEMVSDYIERFIRSCIVADKFTDRLREIFERM
jgi:uncharacterized protein YutE (UPF0331/DUF86 family)